MHPRPEEIDDVCFCKCISARKCTFSKEIPGTNILECTFGITCEFQVETPVEIPWAEDDNIGL